jgi:hypothetical protein
MDLGIAMLFVFPGAGYFGPGLLRSAYAITKAKAAKYAITTTTTWMVSTGMFQSSARGYWTVNRALAP